MSEERFAYICEPGILDIGKMRAHGLYPTDDRIARGPIVVLECGQEIACNPCETACPKNCIHIGDDITAMPRVDDHCTGCGLCLVSCPGLCVFVLNGAYSDKEATITMAYELTPLPTPGETVNAVNRAGHVVCEGTVVSVRKLKKSDPCYALTVAVPKEHIHHVRHVHRRDP